MKYLIGKTLLGGWPVPLVFPEEFAHGPFANALEQCGCKVVSAGFCDAVPALAGLPWTWRVIERTPGGAPVLASTDAMLRRKRDEQMIQLFMTLGLVGKQLADMVRMEDAKNGITA